MTSCKICDAKSEFFAQAKVLGKYDVAYFQCTNCGFVQTEDPYWLAEAYQIPVTRSNIGLVARNIGFAQLTLDVITKLLNVRGRFLDYGAGYGIISHLMQYFGLLNFESYDIYCENIFSPDSVVKELSGSYDLITAFDVFEHWVDPIAELSQLFNISPNLLFATELLPSSNPKPGEWGYYILDEGQHIAFYTSKSLQVIAERFGLNVYSTHSLGHFLTANSLPENIATLIPWQAYEPQNLFPKLQQQLTQALRPLASKEKIKRLPLKILVDGVFFQLYKTGIARVWSSVLREWAGSEFANCITVLDRANTAPKYEGLNYRTIQPYNYGNWEGDRAYLQQICDEEGATIFISSYYTTPLETPSVFMAYDMIPEVLGGNLDEPMWQAKHKAIRHATAYIGISENTLNDLKTYFPEQADLAFTTAYCGVDPLFSPATEPEIAQFCYRYGIQKPYFLLVGPSSGYKNSQLFFRAFTQLPSYSGFALVCTSKHGTIDPQLRQLAPGVTIHTLSLSDEELRLAYGGAIALVYPSRYEGFGMPVIEALACGCPVITSPVSSLPEVGGDAVLYVQPDDLAGMMDALCEIQKPGLRRSLRAAGLQHAKKFTWQHTAAQIQQGLIAATLPLGDLQDMNYLLVLDWTAPEVVLGAAIAEVFQHMAQAQSPVTLVFYVEGVAGETIDLLLSGVAFELMMTAEIDISEQITVTTIEALHPLQWKRLIPRLQGRLALACDDEGAIAQLPNNIPVVEL